MEKAAIDQNVLEGLRELQTEDAPHFLRNYLVEFLKPIPGKIAAIQKAIDESNFLIVESEAHALKSSSANTGAKMMASICAELEELGEKSTLAGAKNLLDKLKAEFERVKCEIKLLPELK